MTDSVTVSVELLNSRVQILVNDVLLIASSVSSDSDWNHVVLTFENTTTSSQMSLSITLFINGTQEGEPVTFLNEFPATLQSVSLGSNYTGLLKDVGLYLPALSATDLDPKPADFIPQCLCYPDSISTTDSSLCTGTTTNNRYI